MKIKTFILICALILSSLVLPLAACGEGEKQTSTYRITAEFDGERTLTGEMDFLFVNSTDNEIDVLKFNLWGNAYREGATYKPVAQSAFNKAYYGGNSFGSMEISGVDGCKQWRVEGVDENLLCVYPDGRVMPEESATVHIDFVLQLANVNHRTGITQKSVNLGNFYPILCAYGKSGYVETPYISTGDPFLSECADYEVKFKLPRTYAAATSGIEVARSEDGDKIVLDYELKNARDFAAVLSNGFETATREVAGCRVTLYGYGDLDGTRLISAACESVEYFSETFGAYPYPTLAVVLTPLAVSGMEYPALAMVADGLGEADAVYAAVHEIAHQWWYAGVGSDQINCAWQDEGLAEYSALCFFESHPEYGYTRAALLGNATKAYRAYFSVYNQLFGKADTTMNRPLDAFASEYEYVNIAYNKGLLLFESLRDGMGDKKFFKALSSYYEGNLFAVATYEELIARFARLHDVEGLFMSFIEGKIII